MQEGNERYLNDHLIFKYNNSKYLGNPQNTWKYYVEMFAKVGCGLLSGLKLDKI